MALASFKLPVHACYVSFTAYCADLVPVLHCDTQAWLRSEDLATVC